MSLPLRLPWDLAQTRWATEIESVIDLPPNQGILIKNIQLINGVTVINHKLSRQMQGWILIDVDAPAAIYRSQPFNGATLTLTSNAAATVSLWMF